MRMCEPNSGQPLRDPLIIRSKAGVLRHTLRISVARVCLGGVSLLMRTYDGSVPGPTLMASPGDRVELLLDNRELGPNYPAPGSSAPLASFRAANSSNLHLHGIYDSSSHDNTFAAVDPGHVRMYHYEINAHSRSSLLWYHPHLEGSTALQLYSGMAGAFVVTHARDDAIFRGWTERVLVIGLFDPDERAKGGAATVLRNNGTSLLDIGLQNPRRSTGPMLIVNGRVAPCLAIAKGSWSRLRIVNAISGANSLLQLGIGPACAFHVLAYDGIFLQAPRAQRVVLLPPGGRVELAVSCSRHGASELITTAPQPIDGMAVGSSVPAGLVALTLDVTDGITTEHFTPSALPAALPTALPGPPSYYGDLRGATPSGRHSFKFGDAVGASVVNGRAYDGSVAFSATVGSVQEWRVSGGEGEDLAKMHPYHHHQSHFQVVSASIDSDGLLVLPGDYRDTVPLFGALNYSIRWRLDFEGLVMVHCHILRHEDMGMMALVRVTAAPPAAKLAHAITLPTERTLAKRLRSPLTGTLAIVAVFIAVMMGAAVLRAKLRPVHWRETVARDAPVDGSIVYRRFSDAEQHTVQACTTTNSFELQHPAGTAPGTANTC